MSFYAKLRACEAVGWALAENGVPWATGVCEVRSVGPGCVVIDVPLAGERFRVELESFERRDATECIDGVWTRVAWTDYRATVAARGPIPPEEKDPSGA